MAPPRSEDRTPGGLGRILLPGEHIVAAVHSHWARIAEPAATTAAALVITLVLDANLTTASASIGSVIWWVWLAVLGRFLYRMAEWRRDWFVATDKRLLLRYGLITHKVAMMPLAKVTDMSYERTVPGQFLGYGRFIMESAGQDQALKVVNWVPHPDATYRAICAEIFDMERDGDVEVDSGFGADGDEFVDAPPGADDDFPDVPHHQSAVQDRLESWSRAVPIHRVQNGETVYESDDVREGRRGPDTGPIRYP